MQTLYRLQCDTLTLGKKTEKKNFKITSAICLPNTDYRIVLNFNSFGKINFWKNKTHTEFYKNSTRSIS